MIVKFNSKWIVQNSNSQFYLKCYCKLLHSFFVVCLFYLYFKEILKVCFLMETDLDEFSMTALAHSESSAVNGCRQNESPNS